LNQIDFEVPPLKPAANFFLAMLPLEKTLVTKFQKIKIFLGIGNN